MKNITKYLGIAGITALSFLPMKNVWGQNVLDGIWIPANYSKLNKSQRDSICCEIVMERASLINDVKSLLVEKNKNLDSEKIDSLNIMLDLYKLKYNFLKKRAKNACNLEYSDLDYLY